MSESVLSTSDSEMIDYVDLEDMLAKLEAVSLQARVIDEQVRDICCEITNIGAGEVSLRTLRVKGQLFSQLRAILSTGALAAPLREPVGVEHLRLMEFYNSVVLREDWLESLHETQEESERDSACDRDCPMDEDSSADDDVSMVEEEAESENEDSVVEIESSSSEEYEPEDLAEARSKDYQAALSSYQDDTDSETEDEDRFKNLNLFYI